MLKYFVKSKLSDLAHLCTGHVTITAESLSCKNLGQLVAEFCNSCQFGKSLCPSLTVQATRRRPTDKTASEISCRTVDL